MSTDAKKGYGSTIAMITLGMLALYGGAHWLVVLVPVGALIWFAADRVVLKRSRN
jgi:hypothetical protein